MTPEEQARAVVIAWYRGPYNVHDWDEEQRSSEIAAIAAAIRFERERWRELATAAWVFCVNPDRINQIRLEAELAALGMSVESPHCTFDEQQPL
jgi:hypothetical protein